MWLATQDDATEPALVVIRWTRSYRRTPRREMDARPSSPARRNSIELGSRTARRREPEEQIPDDT